MQPPLHAEASPADDVDYLHAYRPHLCMLAEPAMSESDLNALLAKVPKNGDTIEATSSVMATL